MIGDEVMTVQEAAGYVKQSRTWIYSQIRRGRLAVVKNGRSTRLLKADLDQLMRANRRPAAAELDAAAHLRKVSAQRVLDAVYGKGMRSSFPSAAGGPPSVALESGGGPRRPFGSQRTPISRRDAENAEKQ